jgi:hypothetical protein
MKWRGEEAFVFVGLYPIFHYSSIPTFRLGFQNWIRRAETKLMRQHGRTNERGMVLILALILLLVLTLIGISAINTSTYETTLSGNERTGTDAFYASEAVVQIGLDHLPNLQPVSRTKIGETSYGWSGGPSDKATPEDIQDLGDFAQPGYDISSWGFHRYQINGTGESLGAVKEIEVQVSYGPVQAGTQYNN